MPYHSLLSPSYEVVVAPPHPLLRPGVRFYRGLRINTDRPRKRLELPVGFATLLLGFDQPLQVGSVDVDTGVDDLDPAAKRSYTSLFAGMRTKSAVGEHPGSLYGIEVVMHPWAAYALFGVPMHELAELLVEPSDLAGARIRRLTERLAELPDWPQRFAALDEAFLRWRAAGPGVAPRVLHAWDLLVGSSGTRPISGLADELGWSERQLERRFREQLGLSPKSAARVLRIQHALRLLIAGRPLAEIATRTGFYDQSHLNREIRVSTGLTPGRLLSRTLHATNEPTRLDGAVTTLMLVE
ncbi:helix-turn-helix domain-containing protein [Yinghuangia seranimata]|uniref:helix-turn-helix domain-containing protein n=1 Tax=Yinghuangia seranimata TaxID=408067 RepID=UPI00248BE794|nr:helix-turn-helix domain-containing protein [Yinghuangia seranimata]MDI2125354.1 helix-turn-helix domain-containing protein [Yinghuangia seranimata]